MDQMPFDQIRSHALRKMNLQILANILNVDYCFFWNLGCMVQRSTITQIQQPLSKFNMLLQDIVRYYCSHKNNFVLTLGCGLSASIKQYCFYSLEAILEEMFDDLLRFVFPNTDQIFNIEKGFDILSDHLFDIWRE
jgi:hypothetical protein